MIRLDTQAKIECGGGALYIYMAMKKAIRPKLGRPRKFDEETAVEAAMLVFWEKGYEGASLSDLTQAMGIDRKSMYLTFGDKEALFKRVLDRYNTTRLAFVPKAFAKPTLREFVDDVLNAAIRFWVDKSHPGTCMTIQNLAVSEEAEPIRRAMAAWRKWRLNTFRDRIERARKEGELPPGLKPEAFARYLSVILAGLAVQASSGATLAELKRTIAMFQKTMPIPMDLESRP
jgi:AcrR family transcriptional regulator